jgi:RNA polymerase-binding transcription factor DksA
VPGDPEAGLILPAWRNLLEARWQQRLATVISRSVAYHDAAERSGGGYGAGAQAETQALQQLMQGAVAARRALSDTEEALARLSAGNYGQCEQCPAGIPAALLALEPEARYCGRCVRRPTGNPEPGQLAGMNSQVELKADSVRVGVDCLTSRAGLYG